MTFWDELLLDPIATLQDDEVAEIAKDDDEETFTDDDVIEIVEDEGRFPLEAGTTVKDDAGVIAELENADSTLNILSVFSSPQATRSIKEQTGNILNKFILQISFFYKMYGRTCLKISLRSAPMTLNSMSRASASGYSLYNAAKRFWICMTIW